jgi:hypothetical protein
MPSDELKSRSHINAAVLAADDATDFPTTDQDRATRSAVTAGLLSNVNLEEALLDPQDKKARVPGFVTARSRQS